MSNVNPLITRLVEKFDQDREEIYHWHECLTQCGFSVPTGEALRRLVANKEKREAKEKP
jgi:hypothetical protein